MYTDVSYTDIGYVYFGAVSSLPDPEHDKANDEYKTTWAIHMYDDRPRLNRWCWWTFRQVGEGQFTYDEHWRSDAPKTAGPAGSILFGKVRYDNAWAALAYMRTTIPWEFKTDFHVIQYLIYICRRLLGTFEGVALGETFPWMEIEKLMEVAISSLTLYEELHPIPSCCYAALDGRRSVLDIVRGR